MIFTLLVIFFMDETSEKVLIAAIAADVIIAVAGIFAGVSVW